MPDGKRWTLADFFKKPPIKPPTEPKEPVPSVEPLAPYSYQIRGVRKLAPGVVTPPPSIEDINRWLRSEEGMALGDFESLTGMTLEEYGIAIDEGKIKDGFATPGEWLTGFTTPMGETRVRVRGEPTSAWERAGQTVISAVKKPLFTVAGVGISAGDIVLLAALGFGVYEGTKSLPLLFNQIKDKVLQKTLNIGLDKWIARMSRGVPPQHFSKTQNALYNFIAKDRVWLQQRATENMLERMGRGISPAAATTQAVDKTITDLEARFGALVPRATQTGAMAMGGVPPVPPIIPPKVPAVAEVTLKATVDIPTGGNPYLTTEGLFTRTDISHIDAVKELTGSADIYKYMANTGDIRISFGKYELNVEMVAQPTEAQVKSIGRAAKGSKIVYDFVDEKGRITKSGIADDFSQFRAETIPAVEVAKPPTVQGLVNKGKVEFDRLAATGKIAPFGGDVIEKQTANELQAVADGTKPVALIAQMDAAAARKLGLVVRRVTAKGERVAGMAEVYGAYKKGNKAALDKLNEVFAKEVTGELKGAEMDVALGGALGYSEADIAKYMQSVHGSYEEFVKATTPEVAAPPAKVAPVELTEEALLETMPIGKLKAKEIADIGVRGIVDKIKGLDIKALPLEYKTKIRDILNDFDIAFRTKKTLTKRASLRAYIERLKADGIEVTVPQSYIDVAYKTSLADMTTEQVQMLHDMVQGLVKMGSLKNKLLRVQAGRRVDEAEGAIVEHLGVPPEEGIISKAAFEQGWYHRTLEKYKGFIARTDRMERLLLMLDGYEPNGLMWRTFYDPLNTATDVKLFGVQKIVEDFRTFLKEQDIDIKRIISIRKEVVPGVELTSSERIGVYLHSLNRDNLAHLKYGNKIDEKTIEAVINQMTPDEIAVAEYLGSYFRDAAPSVSRVRTEVEGKSLEVVENYFPIILERRAETTFMSQERKLIEEALQDFGKEMSLEDEYRFTSKWASARIAKQFIRKRTHRALQPVSLDALEIFIRRMEAMEHYKAFAPPVRDLQLLLNRANVQKAIVAKGGRPVLQVMNQWLKDVAKTNPLAVTSQGEKLLRTLRVNAVTAVLGINLTTAMKQIPSMLIGAAEIGNVPALKGILTSIVHPIETRQMIKDMAPQIYRRSIERELAEAKMMRNLEKRLTDRLSPREAFMFLTVTCDRFVVNGLWRGAFEDYLKKNPGQVNEAAASATAAIRRTQPFFSIKDLPEYWRSGEFMKALTMFTNQLNQYWNYYRHDTFGAAIAGKVGFGTVVKRVLEGFVLSAIIIGWITRSRPPQDAEDIVEDLASMAFATLPLVGHFIVGGYQGFHSDSGLITTEVASMLQELAYYMNKEEWDRAALVIPELGGYIAGVPVAQPKRVIEALINIASGKTDDWLEIIWGSYRREKARKEEAEKKRETPGLFREPEGKFKIEDFLK